MVSTELIEILARLNPAIYEVYGPHGPIGWGSRGFGSQVELNPQQLPPRAAFAGALLAGQVAEGAVLTQAQSGGGQEFLMQVVDDWCGTRGPRPWPPGWPHVIDPDPDPHPWEVAEMFAVAALSFARVAAGLEDGPLRDAFRAAVEKTGERAVMELGEQR
jgi:hypothetical protein